MQTKLSKSLKELDKCYTLLGSYVELATGFAGGEAIARLGDEHFLALIEGQHEIHARVNIEFAQGVLEGALVLLHRIDMLKEAIVKDMFITIKHLAKALARRYFTEIPGENWEEDLVLEGCKAALNSLRNIKEFNTRQCIRHLYKSAIMGMKRYTIEFVELYNRRI